MNQELYDLIQQLQQDSFFRVKQQDDFDHIVNSPFLGSPIASAFERISRCKDEIVEIGRLGVHEVHAICWGLDAVADDIKRISEIPMLTREGAITVRRMAGGRC